MTDHEAKKAILFQLYELQKRGYSPYRLFTFQDSLEAMEFELQFIECQQQKEKEKKHMEQIIEQIIKLLGFKTV